MARKPREKKPTTAVRLAFTGPSIEPDDLIDQAIERNAEDRKRASSAGESRAKIKAFLEETGMNGKALSWLRQVLKTAEKDDGDAKAMDIIMSLEKGLPMIKAHVAGQGTQPMELQPAAPSYSADFDPTDDSVPPVLSTGGAITDEEWEAAGKLLDTPDDEDDEDGDEEEEGPLQDDDAWLAEGEAA